MESVCKLPDESSSSDGGCAANVFFSEAFFGGRPRLRFGIKELLDVDGWSVDVITDVFVFLAGGCFFSISTTSGDDDARARFFPLPSRIIEEINTLNE